MDNTTDAAMRHFIPQFIHRYIITNMLMASLTIARIVAILGLKIKKANNYG